GLVFQNIRVPDANGAGIRLERGNLDVAETMFRDSEQGILTAGDPGGAIRISRSTFSGLGRCDRDLACAHGVYIGEYGSLSIDRSRFERGRGGHYVKSRAPRIELINSSFDDTAGRTTNYMVDLSNGARGRIAGNRFVQGKNKENYSAFIVVAAEGRTNDSTGLAITGNEAVLGAGAPRPTAFVADLSKDRLAIGANNIGAGIERFQQR
ncbi:MAG TPA: right-handed parallel beta-helix repeat-containing protein, partial [Sphingomonadaceae bacterium]|nr:right-handed parallel beta-helix repeat-containing protein [Sphingomonadaceae bacterium]